MKNITIFLRSVLLAISLLTGCLMSAENHAPLYSFCVTNKCVEDINLVFEFPLSHEHAETAPSMLHSVRAGGSMELPVNIDNLYLQIGRVRTIPIHIEDNQTPILISKTEDGHFVGYQGIRRYYLELPRIEKDRWCFVQ
jgi:hypothetical protein